MLIGLDTVFFYALEDAHPAAVEIWKEREIVTSAIVLYELQKKLLQGHFGGWPSVVKDIQASLGVVSLPPEIALEAGYLARGTGMPGLDALILSSLLHVDCATASSCPPWPPSAGRGWSSPS